MINNTINIETHQKKISYKEQLASQRYEWKQCHENLENQKANSPYKYASWSEFMDLTFDECDDLILRSKMIDLQDQYKESEAQVQLLWTEDHVVAEFNKIHAVVHVDSTYILTKKRNLFGNADFSMEGRSSFMAFYEDEIILCEDGKKRSKAEVWLKHPKRLKYKGIIFDPRTTESNNGLYNIWNGFAKKALKGDSSKYWNHIRENICNSNEESYLYLRKWLAYVFQRPDLVHTSIVLCGSQGTGKNSFVEPLGVLLGSHYAPLSSMNELVSNFNFHLKNAVLIHANEAYWGGYKKEIGIIKAMITEQTCLIEGKGKDRIVVRNFKHVILSSNEDFPVHMDNDDRRFFVLRVSEQQKGNKIYFQAINNELHNGGYEALLYDLLNEDIIDFEPRTIPSSSQSFDIKMRSAESSYRYLYEALSEGGFSIGNESDEESPVWQPQRSKRSVFRDYQDWCKNNGEKPQTNELFGKAINKLIKSITDVRPSSKPPRQWYYQFLSLQKTRADFSNAFNEMPANIFNDYESSK